MTLSVNYRGGFAKLSDSGIITKDYATALFSFSFPFFLLFRVFFLHFFRIDRSSDWQVVVNKSDFGIT